MLLAVICGLAVIGLVVVLAAIATLFDKDDQLNKFERDLRDRKSRPL